MRTDLSPTQYRELAEFRQQLQSFPALLAPCCHHLGLQAKEYDLMLVIRGASRGTDIDVPEAGRRMLTYAPDIANLIGRLEKRRFLRRYHYRRRRRMLLRITPLGEAVLRKLVRRTLDDLQTQGPSLEKVLSRIASERRMP